MTNKAVTEKTEKMNWLTSGVSEFDICTRARDGWAANAKFTPLEYSAAAQKIHQADMGDRFELRCGGSELIPLADEHAEDLLHFR
jgi:hypothetical protein